MAKLTLSSIGTLLKEKRGNQGIRETSKEIGISSATLSRIENGKTPDLDSFTKICKWLHIDPAELLNCRDTTMPDRVSENHAIYAHLRAERTMPKEVTHALSEMIFAAQSMIVEEVKES